jgi:hypothetical protein
MFGLLIVIRQALQASRNFGVDHGHLDLYRRIRAIFNTISAYQPGPELQLPVPMAASGHLAAIVFESALNSTSDISLHCGK